MKNKNIISATILIILLAYLILPSIIYASDSSLPSSNIRTEEDVINVIKKLAKWMYELFFVLTVVFVLWAAYLYLTAGQDTDKISEAKKRLEQAVIAIVIALISTGFASIIDTFLKP